jgi:hypothetical protein
MNESMATQLFFTVVVTTPNFVLHKMLRLFVSDGSFFSVAEGSSSSSHCNRAPVQTREGHLLEGALQQEQREEREEATHFYLEGCLQALHTVAHRRRRSCRRHSFSRRTLLKIDGYRQLELGASFTYQSAEEARNVFC